MRQPRDHVVLLHGLARTSRSMAKLEKRLTAEGYRVFNMDYPSRCEKIEPLAMEFVGGAVASRLAEHAAKIHFVTHSMGGILLRYYMKQRRPTELGRVVMLSPPNGGSEVVDKLRRNVLFRWVNGPAGEQMGTGADDLPAALGPVDFELGVIAGDRSVNLLLSLLIPGRNDGKVSAARARVEGMTDFTVIHATHPFIMRNRRAIDLTVSFLKHGAFTGE